MKKKMHKTRARPNQKTRHKVRALEPRCMRDPEPVANFYHTQVQCLEAQYGINMSKEYHEHGLPMSQA